MALLWNTLATREVNLLQYSMARRYDIREGCAWVNYVRCHDDIGWTFSDEDAGTLWINAYDHRRFLNAFYTGRFEGSFARGLPFQENPKTGDARISGTLASLAGLEKALTEETEAEVALAIRRILLLHNVILTLGGIPLIDLGDEVGTLNDYGYRDDPAKADDSRWVHRPRADAALYARRDDPASVPGRIYRGLRKLIELRKATPLLSGDHPEFIQTGNPHVFGYIRRNGSEAMLFLNNFSEAPQRIGAPILQLAGLGERLVDRVSGARVPLDADLDLAPFQYVWLAAEG
jgi:amylosucrase